MRERYKDYMIPTATLRQLTMFRKLATANGNKPAYGETVRHVLASIQATTPRKEKATAPKEPVEGAPKRRKRRTKAEIAAAEAGEEVPADVQVPEFVRLVDLLPPLPSKGEFDVNTIKKSLYFFS